MNLPFILDIAIGLVFIYLIISLLASEIQELLTTILQWRAAHLKKSIEILLTGGEGTANNQEVKSIVEDIYNNPLVKNISQESREGIEFVLRKIVRGAVTLFGFRKNRTLTGNEPSYIPAETFASTLLERLNITQLNQKLVALNLQKLVETEISTQIRGYLEDPNLQITDSIRQILVTDFESFETKLMRSCEAFRDEKITLLSAVNQIEDELDLTVNISFIHKVQTLAETDVSTQPLVDLLFTLRRTLFKNGSEHDITEFIERLQPNIAQIVDLLVDDARVKRQTYLTLRQEIQQAKPSDRMYAAYQSVQNEITAISSQVSPSVRESLAALARRAQINLKQTQTKVQAIEAELNQFQVEVQNWFDRSMDRASGVYKRNAKGVAFLIGLLLSVAINADTFHIVSRLATDTAVRDALTQNAEIVVTNCPTETSELTSPSLNCIRGQINQSLPLPLGWNEVNTRQQAEESNGWFFEPLKRFLGWSISGLAISMGASFWFDLLGKIINVRNAGKRPPDAAR